MERQKAGLCSDCRHRQIVETGRSAFLLCRRGLTDPTYPKYPPLPVVTCVGYQTEREARDPHAPADPDDKLSR